MWLPWNPRLAAKRKGWGPQVDTFSAGWRESRGTGDRLEGKAEMEHKKEPGGAGSTPGDPPVSDRM